MALAVGAMAMLSLALEIPYLLALPDGSKLSSVHSTLVSGRLGCVGLLLLLLSFEPRQPGSKWVGIDAGLFWLWVLLTGAISRVL